MARAWFALVEITDHGLWDPTDEAACAAVIAEVNRIRRPDNRRAKIRRDDWGERKTWLDIEIDDTSIRLDPGEHLVSARMPTGDILRSVMAPDELRLFEVPS